MKRIVVRCAVVVLVLGLLSLSQIAEAGRVGGPWGDHGVIRDGYSMVYDNVYFKGGKLAKVEICGDGPMRLEIYDQKGKRIAWQNSSGFPLGECTVYWTPKTTAPFTIKIVNTRIPDFRYPGTIQFGVASN